MELIDPGVFLALAIVNPGIDPKKVEIELKKEILNTKITKKALDKVKNQTKMDFLTQLESSSGVSNIYGDYFAKGDIIPLLEYEEKINSLTPQKVEEIKKYFDKSVTVTLIKK